MKRYALLPPYKHYFDLYKLIGKVRHTYIFEACFPEHHREDYFRFVFKHNNMPKIIWLKDREAAFIKIANEVDYQYPEVEAAYGKPFSHLRFYRIYYRYKWRHFNWINSYSQLYQTFENSTYMPVMIPDEPYAQQYVTLVEQYPEIYIDRYYETEGMKYRTYLYGDQDIKDFLKKHGYEKQIN